VPTLTVIAGPNGSGKSTVRSFVDFEGRERLLDPDVVARELNPLNPAAAAIAAGREILRRTAEYLSQRVSFAVETTLSGNQILDLIHKAKARDYEIHLVFIALDTPEHCIRRIKNRVAQGGHFIPEADVRRRYLRSMGRAGEVLRSVDVARFYDNSEDNARIILIARAGRVAWRADTLPEWMWAVINAARLP
jgi:predicted ABC-type ATPase